MGRKAKRECVQAMGGVMALVVGVLMVCAFIQTTYWKNGETLWRHTLACAKQNDPDNGLYLAIVHYNIGLAVRQQGDTDAAITQYEEALQSDPDYASARINLGGLLFDMGRTDEAIFHLQKALQTDPNNGQAHNNLGNACLQKGNFSAAMAQFQQAMKLEPSDPWVKNNFAWILAACPDVSLRNGGKAVELASAANELSGGGNPIILHTLAAALAESGRYSEAVETAQRALRLADAQSRTSLAAALESEIKLYQSNRPFHSPSQAQ